MHVLDPRFLLAYICESRGSKDNFHIMDDSEAQNEQNQVSQKNTPNASDGDTNENELSEKTEKTALLLDRNPPTQIMIIPKSKFVELSKGNTKFGDEVIYQKIVVKLKLPDIIFQGGTISNLKILFLTWEQKCVYVQHQNLRVQIYACSSALCGTEAIGNDRPSFCLIF